MTYKVVPFHADIMAGEGAGKAAAQLEALIEHYGGQGWSFNGLENLQTTVITPAIPGTNGCMGIGAQPGRPESRDNAAVYVAVFRKS